MTNEPKSETIKCSECKKKIIETIKLIAGGKKKLEQLLKQ